MTAEGWDAPALYLSDGQFLPHLKLAPISQLAGERLAQRRGLTCAMRHSLSLLAPEMGAVLFSKPTSCSAAGVGEQVRGGGAQCPGLGFNPARLQARPLI